MSRLRRRWRRKKRRLPAGVQLDRVGVPVAGLEEESAARGVDDGPVPVVPAARLSSFDRELDCQMKISSRLGDEEMASALHIIL